MTVKSQEYVKIGESFKGVRLVQELLWFSPRYILGRLKSSLKKITVTVSLKKKLKYFPVSCFTRAVG